MKKNYSFLRVPVFTWIAAVLFILGPAVFAQWQLVDTGAIQFGVTFAKDNPTVVWSVGQSGYIRRSLDGGYTFASQPSNTSNQLDAITSVDSNVLWTVGQSGLILKTTNGGTSWNAQTSGVGSELFSVSAVDANTAWAVGSVGIIRKTINGTTWAGQTSGTTQPLKGVFAVNSLVAWAVGNNGTILKTTNGGTNWTAQTSGTTLTLSGITAIDASTAWAVGDSGTILKTTDGGTTWSPQTSGAINALFSVAAANANVVWAAGDSGTMLKSLNGGGTWTAVPSGSVRQLLSVAAVDDQTAIAVGFFGTVRVTNDGGASFVGQTTGTSQQLNAITSNNEQQIFTVGDSGGARSTTNGGTTWNALITSSARSYYAVAKAGTSELWAAGFAGTIVHSANAGANWDTQTTLAFSGQFNGIGAASSSTLWAVGEGGMIATTTNGGVNWASQASSTTNNLNGISVLNATTAWAVGNAGTILKWNGAAWSPQTSGTVTNLNAVTAVDANTVYAVGFGGLILKTTNGGANWVPQSSNTTQRLNAVAAFDAGHVWAAGANGAIVSTVNGATWTVEPSPTVTNWTSVTAVGPTKAYIAGNTGSVIRNFTPINPPVVVTRNPTSIQGSSVTMNASITPNGATTTAYIEWGPGVSGPYTSGPLSLTLNPPDGPVGQLVSVNVTGLDPRSPYHYRAVATNISGTSTGLAVAFNTINSVPVATLSSVTTDEEVPATITLTATDADSDSLTYQITSGLNPGAAGSLSALSNGNQVTFTPTENFNGTATFKYTASDAFGGVSNEQTVTITVNPVNDLPTISADQAAVSGNLNTIVTNTGIWADVDNDNVVLSASLGEVIKNGNGTWSWSHSSPTAVAGATITITADDGHGGISTATFLLDIGAPASIAISKGLTAVPDNAGGAPIVLAPAPIGGSQVTVFTIDNPGDGTLQVSGISMGNGVFTATTAGGGALSFPIVVAGHGSASFGIKFTPVSQQAQNGSVDVASNAQGSLGTYSFNVAALVNRAPVAVNDTLTLPSTAAFEATALLANDSDPDNDAISITGYTQGASGAVTQAGNGNLVYTPGPTFLGYDEFSYTISDTLGATATATVVVDGGVLPPPVGPGTYATLLTDSQGEAQGMVTFKFSGNGGATGQLKLGRVTYRFSGPTINGAGSFTARAKGNPDVAIASVVGTDGFGHEALLFTINGGALTGSSTKCPYNKTTHPPRVGRYVVLAANDNNTDSPVVGACLSFRVMPDGAVSWKGKNGAGYNITGGSYLLTAGLTPMYSGRAGAQANALSSNVIITVPRVYGNIHWDFSGTDVRIPAAFASDYPITGEAYTKPVNNAAMLDSTFVKVTLNLPSYTTDKDPASNNPTIRILNVNTLASPNLPILKVAFDRDFGFFSGKTNVQGAAPRAIFGVFLPSEHYGRGAVMDIGKIGSARIEATSPN